MSEFKQYRRREMAELRPYVEGERMTGISVSYPDQQDGSPKPGDMIARNPKNHMDQWLVAAAYFADNFEALDEIPVRGTSTADGSIAPTAEQDAIITERIQELLRVFIATPNELKDTVAVSFIVSTSMSTKDPLDTFQHFTEQAGLAIDDFLAQRSKVN